MCEPNSPQALAEAVLKLHQDPDLCARLADQGQQLYMDKYTPAQLGARLLGYLNECIESRKRR
jgi:glycosyltransferase involved in cell wall biosynthesis